ncbi:MAG: tetratricopeptide repeat protein [Candidatus Omnitrophica bacterium]|nr:tetratricopeptide repeat protein [Candidatus Omnitrophota bacterium]
MRKFNLPSSKSGVFILLAVILTVVFFSYYPTLKNDFVFWDDDVHLYENISVRTLDFEHVSDIFKSTVNKIYIPLTTFSFAIEYHFFEYDPFIYHLDNLLLHLGVVAFAFWLGLRLGLSVFASGIAALLFGIHPIHVESVAWVTERKDVLYSFFYMAALLSYSYYLGFTKSTPSLQIKKSYRFLVLTFIFGIFSMLAKPMALSLPLILLLFDWFHGRAIRRAAIFEKIPLALAIAGITWISYVSHARVPGKNIVEGFLIWAWTFVFYLKKFTFPIISVPIYQLPQPVTIVNSEYLLSVMVFCLLIFALFRFRKHQWFIFSMAFYFFSIFFLLRYDETPEGPNIVADRFMYLPSVGFCLFIGYVFQLLVRRQRTHTLFAIMALVVLFGVFSVKTFRQCKIWHDSISLWEHELRYFPEEPVALNNLAAALREQEEYKEAEKVYKKFKEIQSEGLAIDFSNKLMDDIKKVDYVKNLYAQAVKAAPNFKDSYYHFGNLMKDLGNISEAVAAYKKALELDYEYKDAHFSLGDLYRQAGDYGQAIFAYDQTIKLHPEDQDVYFEVISAYNEELKKNPQNAMYRQARKRVVDDFTRLISSKPARATSFFNLGYVYGEMGDFLRAISAYQMALDINPNHSKTLYNLGNIYRDQGRLGEALEVYKKVIKIDPKKSDAFINMGTIHKRHGDQGRARENFQKAIKADPRNARAYFDLGYVEESSGNLRAAIDLYGKAIEWDSKNKEAYYNLGNIYARIGKNPDAILSYLKAVEVDSSYMDAWINLSILSFKEGDFANAVKYYDEAFLLGYVAPQGYLNALEPYRGKRKENSY